MATRMSYPVSENGVEGNQLPAETEWLLMITSTTEDDRRIAGQLHTQLDSKDYSGFLEATDYIPGDSSSPYSSVFIKKALKSRKILALITPSYLASRKFKEDMALVERITKKKGKKVLIPILKEVPYDEMPPRLRIGIAGRPIEECPVYGDSEFNPCLIQQLTREKPLEPAIASQGIPMANGHYLNYLRYILPANANNNNKGLIQRLTDAYNLHINRTDDTSIWDCSQNAIFCPKFIEIIPVTGEFHATFEEYDPQVTALRYLPDQDGKQVKIPFTMDMPGQKGKPYPSCLSKATVDGMEYIFSGEVPSTLKTLDTMKELNMDGYAVKQDAVTKEVWEFHDQLVKLVHSANPRDPLTNGRTVAHSILIINYDGSVELSRLIANAIESQL